MLDEEMVDEVKLCPNVVEVRSKKAGPPIARVGDIDIVVGKNCMKVAWN